MTLARSPQSTAEQPALLRLACSAQRSAHRTAATLPCSTPCRLPLRSATFQRKIRPALILATAFALPRPAESRCADRPAPAQECLLARELADGRSRQLSTLAQPVARPARSARSGSTGVVGAVRGAPQ